MNQYDKSRPESIQAMFGSIALGYDLANAILSFNLHRYWNAKLIRSVLRQTKGSRYLDLCCGTGDIAFGYLKKTKNPTQATLLDFCPEMLECARLKEKRLSLSSHSIHYTQGNAEALPMPANSFDCATMAYGIRNISNPLKSLQEAHRVLVKGGIFGILELTEPTNTLARKGHNFYLHKALPLLGKWVTSNQCAYEYLCRSIQNFIPPEKLESLLIEAGCNETSKISLCLGTATLLLAKKCG